MHSKRYILIFLPLSYIRGTILEFYSVPVSFHLMANTVLIFPVNPCTGIFLVFLSYDCILVYSPSTLLLVIFSLFLQIVWAGPCRLSGQRQIIFGSPSWEAWSRQILQRNRTVRESEGERILLGLAWASLHHGGLSGRGLVSWWLLSLRTPTRRPPGLQS